MISDVCGLKAISDSCLSSFSTVPAFLSLGSGALSGLSWCVLAEGGGRIRDVAPDLSVCRVRRWRYKYPRGYITICLSFSSPGACLCRKNSNNWTVY